MVDLPHPALSADPDARTHDAAQHVLRVERLAEFTDDDLAALCEATSVSRCSNIAFVIAYTVSSGTPWCETRKFLIATVGTSLACPV